MSLFSRPKPKIKSPEANKERYGGWLKCTHCGELMHQMELKENYHCCPNCDFHYRLAAQERIQLLADRDTFTPEFEDLIPLDCLSFCDTESYPKRLEKAAEKSGQSEAISMGICQMNGRDVVLGALDFTFMGGSMGSVVGEKVTLGIELAIKRGLPVVIVSNSGGARMQESIFSLMQMAKTATALAHLERARLPYISVLTNPTAGGVTASFGSLGDIIIAEPKALICFAGPRVVEQAMRHKLPPEAQRAEFLLQRGMIDRIAARRDLKQTIETFLDYLFFQR